MSKHVHDLILHSTVQKLKGMGLELSPDEAAALTNLPPAQMSQKLMEMAEAKMGKEMGAMKKKIAQTLGVPVVVSNEQTGEETTLVSQEDIDELSDGEEEVLELEQTNAEAEVPQEFHSFTEELQSYGPAPLLVWYDSKSHGQRRYFVDLKSQGSNRPLWSYNKSDAKAVDDPMFAYLIRQFCRHQGYSNVLIGSFADPEC